MHTKSRATSITGTRLQVLIGRNNKQNDELSTRVANGASLLSGNAPSLVRSCVPRSWIREACRVQRGTRGCTLAACREVT